MQKTKMKLLWLVIAVALIVLPLVAHAWPEGFLRGDWDVVCPQCGNVDRVSGITENHYDSRCGYQSVNEGTAMVRCPYDGSVDWVSGITESHICRYGHEVRR